MRYFCKHCEKNVCYRCHESMVARGVPCMKQDMRSLLKNCKSEKMNPIEDMTTPNTNENDSSKLCSFVLIHHELPVHIVNEAQEEQARRKLKQKQERQEKFTRKKTIKNPNSNDKTQEELSKALKDQEILTTFLKMLKEGNLPINTQSNRKLSS